MALIYCPDCKKEVSDNAESCPKCGYRLSNIPKEDVENLIKKHNTFNPNNTTFGIISCVFGVLSFIASWSGLVGIVFMLSFVAIIMSGCAFFQKDHNDCNIIGLSFALAAFLILFGGRQI